MLERLTEVLSKTVQYAFLPLQFHQRFLKIIELTFSQRGLVAELIRLKPHQHWFQHMGIQTILDVGANTGPFAFAMRTLLPDAQIYSFEPLPDCHARLVANLSPYGKFQAFCTAVGEKSGDLTFYRSSFAESSSALPMGALHKRSFPWTAENISIQVPVARLDDFLPVMKLQGATLLKIDVQGYEDRVLRGATQTLEQVQAVMTEVSYQPLYEGQVLFEGMYDFMLSHGFHYVGTLESLFSPLDGSILQSDALFIRNQS